MKGSQALEKILSGNNRFVQGERTGVCNRVDVDLGGYGAIPEPHRSCSKLLGLPSPTRHVLDKKIGEIFVVRVAGKVPGSSVIGSLEYAVLNWKVPLLLVLGHENCGAVKAALESKGDELGGALGGIIKELEPVVNPVLGEGKDVDGAMHDAVDATVRYTMARILERSTVIAAAVLKGDLLVKGAVYSLSTNEVTILEEEG